MDENLDLKAEEIASYYNEMVRSHLVELEVETPDGKIVLKRLQANQPNSSSAGTNFRRRKTDFILEKELAAVPSTHKSILSPIMGIFYRASSPQSAPFAREGDTVNAGQTLCIVEAMKVMNEIKSDVHGKVVRILAENGKPVTKGQEIMHVEPV